MRILPEDRPVLDALEAREAEIVERAVEWCAVNSGSRHLAGLEKQKLILAELLDDLPGDLRHRPLQPSPEVGDDGTLHHQPHADALLMTVRPEAPVQVVLTGHYDTVYPAESVFRKVVVRDDGALNGPGVADMKGGISVMLAALEAFERHPMRERVGYRVLLSPDEEIGSLGSGAVLAEIGKLGHVGLTYEPALSDGTLAGARKGSGNFHLVVKGRAAHAGRDFALGRNAVAAAAELAVRLHALNGRREGVTVNVAKISGGAPLNVVADTAVVRFNVRVPDAESAAWIDAAIDQVAAVAPFEGISIHRHGGFTRAAKPFDAAQAALFGAVKAAGELLGQPIGWKPSGGVCEGNNLYAVGLPNVDTLGVRGGDIHSEHEYAWPQSFVERAQLSALILMKLASGEIDAAGIRALRDAGPRVALAGGVE